MDDTSVNKEGRLGELIFMANTVEYFERFGRPLRHITAKADAAAMTRDWDKARYYHGLAEDLIRQQREYYA